MLTVCTLEHEGPVVPEGLLAWVSPTLWCCSRGLSPNSQGHSTGEEIDPVFSPVLLRDRTPFLTHTISRSTEPLIPSSSLLWQIVRREERVVPVRREQVTQVLDFLLLNRTSWAGVWPQHRRVPRTGLGQAGQACVGWDMCLVL